MTERPDKITAEFIPPPPVVAPTGKIVVRAPLDKRGHPIFPDLHLSVEHAWELFESLEDVLGKEFPVLLGGGDAEPRTQGNASDC